MREKIIRVKDPHEVVYKPEHIELLKSKRSRAIEIMNVINIPAILYGSLARGDVNTDSDVDIVLKAVIETYMLEMPLLDKGYKILNRELLQANPNSVPKAHFELEENTTLTVPLFTPSRNEEEFYRFGGAVDLEELKKDQRKPGITKKLLFIDPTDEGHIEYSILGREVEAAKKLGVHLETVKERVRVLSRRDRIGRTGVYLKVQIEPDGSFESTWKYLSDRDPVLRRSWKTRKK